jgi:hypothetical protein
MNEAVIVLILTFIVMGFVFIALVSLPAYQAYRRGYNPIVWALAGIFAINPIFILVILGMVPHRSRVRLRQQFCDDLDRKLRDVHGEPVGSTPGVGWRADLYSVGDQVTQLPEQSIGDDQTRL